MKSSKIQFIQVCFILLITGLIVSCGDDFLKPRPLSSFMPENTYTNKAAMISLLNINRLALKGEFLGNPWPLCSEYSTSDHCIYAEPFVGSLKDLNLQMTPTSVPNVHIVNNSNSAKAYWNMSFEALRAANIVISRYDQAKYETEEDKYEILAEGYFHRAYWYYRIVHQYGDVPYIDKEITSPTVNLFTMSRKAILKRLITDMEFSVQHLPVKVRFGEVSRAAGYHLLTKLYLSVGRFDDAIRAATEVIDKSGLALMKNRFGTRRNPAFPGHDGQVRVYQGNVLWDLFQKENISHVQNTEGILIAQDRVDSRGGKGSSDGGSRRTRTFGPNWLGLPGMIRSGALYEYLLRGQAFTRQTWYAQHTLWENAGDDLRHTWPNWFPMDSVYYNNPADANFGKPAIKPVTDDSIRNWFDFQYYKIYVLDEINDPKVNNNAQGGFTDFYVFRLAETYLLRAEAYWWVNNLESAKNDINEVRGRAHATLITAADVTIDYILDERMRELYTEEPRKTELTRIAFIMADQNRDGYSIDNIHLKNFFYDRVMRRNEFYSQQTQIASGQFTMSPFHYLWPIPQTSIDANVEGHINQNLGYTGSENNIKPLE